MSLSNNALRRLHATARAIQAQDRTAALHHLDQALQAMGQPGGLRGLYAEVAFLDLLEEDERQARAERRLLSALRTRLPKLAAVCGVLLVLVLGSVPAWGDLAPPPCQIRPRRALLRLSPAASVQHPRGEGALVLRVQHRARHDRSCWVPAHELVERERGLGALPGRPWIVDIERGVLGSPVAPKAGDHNRVRQIQPDPERPEASQHVAQFIYAERSRLYDGEIPGLCQLTHVARVERNARGPATVGRELALYVLQAQSGAVHEPVERDRDALSDGLRGDADSVLPAVEHGCCGSPASRVTGLWDQLHVVANIAAHLISIADSELDQPEDRGVPWPGLIAAGEQIGRQAQRLGSRLKTMQEALQTEMDLSRLVSFLAAEGRAA